MRPDVKLGVIVSLVVVLSVGGYFLLRGKREPAIPVMAAPAASSSKTNLQPGKIDRTATGKPQTTPPKTKPESVTIPPATRTAEKSTPAASPSATQPNVASPAASPATGMASTTNPTSTNPTASPTGSPAPVSPTALTSTRSPDATSPGSLNATPASTLPMSQPVAGNSTPPTVAPSIPATNSVTKPENQPLMSNATTPSTARPAPPASPLANQPMPVVSTTPSSTPVKSENAAVETHRVQAGDSLASLSRRYYGSERYVDHLIKSNPQIKDPTRLSIGMSVNIPAEPQASATNTETVLAQPKMTSLETKTATASANAAQGRTYQVKQGDSFYAIARDVLGDANRWNEILALNREKVDGNPNRLRVGQVLVLPGT